MTWFKTIIKEAIDKGVDIEDYIKTIDKGHRYYYLINPEERKNKLWKQKHTKQK